MIVETGHLLSRKTLNQFQISNRSVIIVLSCQRNRERERERESVCFFRLYYDEAMLPTVTEAASEAIVSAKTIETGDAFTKFHPKKEIKRICSSAMPIKKYLGASQGKGGNIYKLKK